MPKLTTQEKVLSEIRKTIGYVHFDKPTSGTTVFAFDAVLRTACVSFTDRLGDYKVNPVYVLHFCQESKQWILDTQLVPAENQPLDGLGAALALSGDGKTICVGAPSSERLMAYTGAAYVFKKDDRSWVESDALYGGHSENDMWFGGSVALDDSGEILCVGSPCSRGTEKNQEGQVYVFSLKPDFKLKTRLWLPPEIQCYRFGNKVAINKRGDSIAVESYKKLPQRDGVTRTQSVDNPKQLHRFFRHPDNNWMYESTCDVAE